MLEELLKHDRLGNKEELIFFLFDGLPSLKQQSISDLHKYCISHIFSMAHSFPGIVKLCEFISFAEVTGEKIRCNKNCFDVQTFQKHSYFDQFHMFGHLVLSLEKYGIIEEIFNKDNLKFNTQSNRYYVLDSKFPYKFFPIRNFLLATGFFEREADLENHLLIRREFTEHFKTSIVDKISNRKNKIKKISLEQLKKSLANKEKAGKEAELWVLEYEGERLNGHPDVDKICLIPDEFVNAGYDIESFDDNDSIFLDRFIEVKSYEGEMSFYWSKNEVQKAKELGEKYFVYLIDRSMMKKGSCQPKKFQNPYKKIFENELWMKETETWRMTFIDSPDH